MRYTVSILSLFFTAFNLFGQGSISVDHYSGQAQVTIPLTAVNDRGLSHHVGLVYNADAIKVDDISGWVGTNWTLVAGGEVKRELRGLPDDYTSSDATDLRRGWLFNNNASTIGNYAFPTDGSAPASCNPATLYNFIDGFNNNVDTEPDLFHFNASEISGTFVFDNTGSITGIKVIPYQDIKISAIRNTPTSPISSFEILTPFGVKYTFSTIETSEKLASNTGFDHLYFKKEFNWYKTKLKYNTSWKLTKIESPLGEKITFTYATRGKTNAASTEVGISWLDPNIVPPPTKTQFTTTNTDTLKILSEINTPHQQIIFVKYPKDIGQFQSTGYDTDTGVILAEMTINEITATGSTWVKTYSFKYATPTDDDENYIRRFLSKINITTPCEYLPPYSFEYTGVGSTGFVPAPGSAKQDLWGYYYETGSNYLYPRLYVYPSQSGINRISLFQKSGMTDEIIVPGANRVPNGTSLAGSMAKITYPSGAVDTLEYESHQFISPITNTATSGGGLRIKKITTKDGVSNQAITRTYSYTNTSGATSGRLITLPSFWLISGFYKQPDNDNNKDNDIVWVFNSTNSYNLSPLSAAAKWSKLIVRTKTNLNEDVKAMGNVVAYEAVTETLSSGNGKTVFSFDVPYTYGASADANWNPTYINVAASNACPEIGLNQPGFFMPPFIQQTPVNFRRGLLTRVAVFKESDSNPLKEVVYSYQDKLIGQTDVKGLNFEFIPYNATGYYFLLGAYKLKTNVTRILTSRLERIRDELTPSSYFETTVNYSYGASHNFITSSTTANSDGSQAINRTKYAMDYGNPDVASSDLQVNMIDALNASGRTAEIVEQTSSISVGGTEKTMGGSLSLYDDFGTVGNARILPKQKLMLDVGDGITGFSMSSISGSGAGRVFTKNGSYRTSTYLKFDAKGDLTRVENDKRQVQSYHTETLTGLGVVTISNAEPDEVVYSNFDHLTSFGFDTYGFTSTDKTASGKHATLGLGGVSNDPAKYLKKQFKKKAGSKYVFSAWYKPSAITGTHTLSITIKDLANVQLQQYTISYDVSPGVQWYYGEKSIDISGISSNDLIIEVRFSGTAGLTSTLDELLFSPIGTEVSRSAYQNPYGPLSITGIDGRMVQYERDKSGRVRQVRDHENNIVKKMDYHRWRGADWAGDAYVNIIDPYDDVFINEPAIFKAVTGCYDVSTIEWKVTPQSDPNGGTFVNGTDQFTYSFPASINYYVFVRISHPSYGVQQLQHLVTVLLRPLTVSICQEGASRINICNGANTYLHECTGGSGTGALDYTSFTATPSGRAGGTYTYKWYRRNSGGSWGNPIGSNSTVSVINDQSYDVKCVVTSSCGSTGESLTKSVSIYSSPINCSSGGMN